jgi:hypothetical protein
MSFPPVSLAVYFPPELEGNAEQGSQPETKSSAVGQSKLFVVGCGLVLELKSYNLFESKRVICFSSISGATRQWQQG